MYKITNQSIPHFKYPFLYQCNYSDGSIGFYISSEGRNDVGYEDVVAIWKPKKQ